MAFTKWKQFEKVKFIVISCKDFQNINCAYKVEGSGGSVSHGEVLG